MSPRAQNKSLVAPQSCVQPSVDRVSSSHAAISFSIAESRSLSGDLLVGPSKASGTLWDRFAVHRMIEIRARSCHSVH